MLPGWSGHWLSVEPVFSVGHRRSRTSSSQLLFSATTAPLRRNSRGGELLRAAVCQITRTGGVRSPSPPLAPGRPELPGVAELHDWWATMASVNVKHDGAANETARPMAWNGWRSVRIRSSMSLRPSSQGFEADITVVDGVQRPAIRCGRCRHLGDPTEFTVSNIRRFEGPTSPEDEALLALYCPSCQVGGVLVSAYGSGRYSRGGRGTRTAPNRRSPTHIGSRPHRSLQRPRAMI